MHVRTAAVPRLDLVQQLNEIEARREEYPETLAFIGLLNALVAPLLPRAAGPGAAGQAGGGGGGLPEGGADLSTFTLFVQQVGTRGVGGVPLEVGEELLLAWQGPSVDALLALNRRANVEPAALPVCTAAQRSVRRRLAGAGAWPARRIPQPCPRQPTFLQHAHHQRMHPPPPPPP